MTITIQDPRRIVIQQGAPLVEVWGFPFSDARTFQNFTGWNATFQLFNRAGENMYRWDSTKHPNIQLGLWTYDGQPVADQLYEITTMQAYQVYVMVPQSLTSKMQDWGIGHCDLDVIDPLGRVRYRWHSECVLEEGTSHG